MILEQKFLQSDLDEVGRILSKSSESRLPIFKRGSRWNTVWKRLFMGISFILLGCSILLIILGRTFSAEIKIYVFVGGVGILTVALWNCLEKKTEPLSVAKGKYGAPFSVEFQEAFDLRQL